MLRLNSWVTRILSCAALAATATVRDTSSAPCVESGLELAEFPRLGRMRHTSTNPKIPRKARAQQGHTTTTIITTITTSQQATRAGRYARAAENPHAKRKPGRTSRYAGT